MQILFVRNAQSRVKQITLTGRSLIVLLSSVVFALMILNIIAVWVLAALGFESKPPVSDSFEARYDQKLGELGAQLSELSMRIKRLDAVRQQLIDETPAAPKLPTQPTDKVAPFQPKAGGQGGPLITVVQPIEANASFDVRVDQLVLGMKELQAQSLKLSDRLYAIKSWHASAPTGYPLPYIVPVTSLPGIRVDPFTSMPSWHAGTDYAAYAGMPIMATGDGYVIRAEWDKDFGNVVELSHPGVNMTTRYAHAEDFYVKLGQRVRRGEVIARVGSTGRSTGPHLHYELHTLK